MDLQTRLRPLIWSTLACAAVLFLPEASGIAKECSACSAVAGELQTRIEKEKPKNHLDLRNRLDSEGNRYGKVIEFKLSELRIVELLEGLCESMNEYEYAASPATNETQSSWQWVKGDEVKLKGWTRLDKPEKVTRRKEIENYCARLVEVHEDAVSGALRRPDFPPSGAPSNCTPLTDSSGQHAQEH